MGYLSLSVALASVVYVLIRPPSWMPAWFVQWRHGASIQRLADIPKPNNDVEGTKKPDGNREGHKEGGSHSLENQPLSTALDRQDDAQLMPPPPIPTFVEPEEQTTPKASPSQPSAAPVPTFSLEEPSSSASSAPSHSGAMPPPPKPNADALSMPPPPVPTAFSRPFPASSSTSSTTDSKPAQGRLPTLSQFPAANSAQRARGPTPARGPPTSSSSTSGGLGPPPTITTKPTKPSRKVLLEPGHSPLDWASISGPAADLRNLPPDTPYLRVTPSMLKQQTGRKGKDAWMAINGKVYNVTPYAKYHPGGVPELMRGAGRDGSRLFFEIHPWVNYETMLSACLVGLMVEEEERSGMDDMD